MIKKYQPVTLLSRRLFSVIMVTLSSVLFVSCKVYQPAYYFKDIKRDTIISGFFNTDLELKVQKNDVLTISISSLNPLEDQLFNKQTSISQTISGFLVGVDGNIYIHKLGKISVVGLTRQQLKQKLEQDLAPFLKEPIVIVNFANHRITVFGDKSSQVINMPDEKMPLLEIMAAAGGVTTDSRLNSVMVIRENGNAKEFKHLNLEDPSIFTSSWYYLQPNDIVVVKPNEEKINAEQKRIRNQLLYTTILSGVTFVFLIVDRIFR